MCALATLADFKLWIGTSSSSGSDALLQAVLDAGEREVLNYCRRSTAFTGFEQSTGLTRYYSEHDIITFPLGAQYPEPHGQTVLWLGNADLRSVDTLLNGDGETISSTSYRLEPRGSTGTGPYRYLRLLSDAAWSWDTDGEIAVTGTWGYSSAPDAAVIGAVKETAKYLYQLRLTQTADVTYMPDLGQLTIPQGMPKHVELVLVKGGYRRTLGAY